MSPYFPYVFQPIRIGSKQSRNCIMRLATLTNTSEDDLASELREAGLTAVHLIGDAYMPRRLANAIAEGSQAARAV